MCVSDTSNAGFTSAHGKRGTVCQLLTLMSLAATGVRNPDGASDTYMMWPLLSVSAVPFTVVMSKNSVAAAMSRCGMWLTGLHTSLPSSSEACAGTWTQHGARTVMCYRRL